MGSLVKDCFTRQQNLSPDKIFHVIVVPCYDKKLEALREDVPTALHISQGAECMLTSGEIVYIMEQSDLTSEDTTVDTLFGDVKEKEVRLHEGASSDRYLVHIFRHTAKELFNEDVGVLTYLTLRNKDFQEVTLERDGEVLLRFAAAYGFRNIQNVVLKLWRGKFPCHFVEVLACAGHAYAAGARPRQGQVCRQGTAAADGRHLHCHPGVAPRDQRHVQELYQEWLGWGATPPGPRQPCTPPSRAQGSLPGHQVVKVQQTPGLQAS